MTQVLYIITFFWSSFVTKCVIITFSCFEAKKKRLFVGVLIAFNILMSCWEIRNRALKCLWPCISCFYAKHCVTCYSEHLLRNFQILHIMFFCNKAPHLMMLWHMFMLTNIVGICFLARHDKIFITCHLLNDNSWFFLI